MPVRRLLERVAEREQARLRAFAPDKLDGDRQS